MSRDLPPPITAKSTRAEMWEEIQSLRAEIDHQQAEIGALRAAGRHPGVETLLRYQLDLIRKVLEVTPTPSGGL